MGSIFWLSIACLAIRHLRPRKAMKGRGGRNAGMNACLVCMNHPGNLDF